MLLSSTWVDSRRYQGSTKFLRKRPRKEASEEGTVVENEFLMEVNNLKETIPEWDTFFQAESDEMRGNHWIRLEILGQPLLEKYAWGIPDQCALNILAEFSPLVEIGAGKGYWASLLRSMGVSIRSYDRFIYPEKVRWAPVLRGGPSVLQHASNQGRNLFISYPDEDQELLDACLQKFTGEYIIHVGELLTTGTFAGGGQTPFGRTTSSAAQIHLMQHFHCLLAHRLPNFPFGNDFITVWQRKAWVPGRSGAADDQWVDIEPSARLIMEGAAPAYVHLLQTPATAKSIHSRNGNGDLEDVQMKKKTKKA